MKTLSSFSHAKVHTNDQALRQNAVASLENQREGIAFKPGRAHDRASVYDDQGATRFRAQRTVKP
jgi:hypothetical protein